MKPEKQWSLKIIIFPLVIFSILLSILSTIYIGFYALFFTIPIVGASVYLLLRGLNLHQNLMFFIKHLDQNGIGPKNTDFSVPTAIINHEKKFIWYNKLFFENVLNSQDAYGSHIEALGTSLENLIGENPATIRYFGKSFFVYTSTPDENDTITLYFIDNTSLADKAELYTLTRPVVMSILIDNYDEILSELNENEKIQILSGVNTIIEDFVNIFGAFAKKLEKDRFIAVLEEQHLTEIIERRFEILDSARRIVTSNNLPITLSLGVGHGVLYLADAEKYSRQALDMATGRGGDQAAVKSPEGYEFFGGVSKSVEKRTKAKTRIVAKSLLQNIHASDKVYIMGHKFGDFDSLGSAIALAVAIRSIGKDAWAVYDPQTNQASVLFDSVPEKDQNIFISPENALDHITTNSMLIVVDTHITEFLDSVELYEAAHHVVVIDHHRKMVNYIDNTMIFYQMPYASSTCELVAELIQYMGDSLRITKYAAEALLSGIMLDTKKFAFKTGVRTFEAATFLRRQGADMVNVRKLFLNDFESSQFKSIIIAGAKIYKNCAISVDNTNCENIRIVAAQAADELLEVSGVDASFTIYEADDMCCISARSMGELNVQIIMEKLGGGGHHTMAACQMKDTTKEIGLKNLMECIDFVQNK